MIIATKIFFFVFLGGRHLPPVSYAYGREESPAWSSQNLGSNAKIDSARPLSYRLPIAINRVAGRGWLGSVVVRASDL